MADRRPTWLLVRDIVKDLQRSADTFELVDIIDGVQSLDGGRGRTSIQPIVQGMTLNAGHGPPSPCGKVLERVEHGRYRLLDGADIDGHDADWHLAIGDTTTRSVIADRYGGSRFGGINPSNSSPNVFIYSDKDQAEAHGYSFDGWADEEATVFNYTGHGPEGDQEMKGGNAAVLHHRTHGRTLRLFVADGIETGTRNTKRQRYVGNFILDEDEPYFVAEGPDRNGDLRAVLVFRMRPVGSALVRDEERSGAPPRSDEVIVEAVDVDSWIEEVEIEAQHNAEFERQEVAPLTARRRESELVSRYRSFLETQGHTVKSYSILPPYEYGRLRVDLFDVTTRELYEAKGRTTRSSIRMAIGQLVDYRRFIDAEGLAVLLPNSPSKDLLALLGSLGISCVYEYDGGFVRVEQQVESA